MLAGPIHIFNMISSHVVAGGEGEGGRDVTFIKSILFADVLKTASVDSAHSSVK